MRNQAMQITSAKFIKGVTGDDYSLKDNLSHIAFFGRSNAGKSSTINSLVNRKNLVKTSKTPGKTREANFFLINNSLYFVDFPGYGFAKMPAKERNRIIKRIFWYLESSNKRPEAVFLIIDAKVGLTVLDKEMIEVLRKNNHQIVIIANKIDKLRQLQREKQLSAIKEEAEDIPVFKYSAKTKEGKEDVLEKIESVIKT